MIAMGFLLGWRMRETKGGENEGYSTGKRTGEGLWRENESRGEEKICEEEAGPRASTVRDKRQRE